MLALATYQMRSSTPITMQIVSNPIYQAYKNGEAKQCKECGQIKFLDEFPLFSTQGAGRKNTCKHCSNKQATVRRRLRRNHPVPPAGDCPACGRHTTKWVLDHDHKTDKFRGYICDSCNVAFGKFDDDPATMHRSLTWLQSHG